MAGTLIKVAVVHGRANAKTLMGELRAGTCQYHFSESMRCPGGCIGGGGQPISTTDTIRQKRMASIYSVDRDMALRKSHENPAVKQLYSEFLGFPNGHRSHHLLHTHYTARSEAPAL